LGLAAGVSAQVSGSGGIDPPRESTRTDTPARPAGAATIDLRPKFRLNEPYRLRLEQTSSGTTIVQQADAVDSERPEPVKQTMSQVFELRFVPKNVAPGGAATVDMIVDAVKLSLKSGDMDLSFDSRDAHRKAGPKPGAKSAPKPASPNTPDSLQETLAGMDESEILASIVGPLVGSVTTFTFDENGNVTQVTGGEAWNLAGLASLTGGTGQLAGADAGGLGQFLNLRPGSNRARIGETWTTDAGASRSPVGDFSMNTRYTLKGASGPRASIDFLGSVEPGTQSPLGMQVREATCSGQAEWDTGLGFLRSMQADSRVTLEGSIAGVRARLDTSARINVTLLR
jgi:hypothetical protein